MATLTPERVALAHAIDDHEKDRTYALRVSRAAATLLADGLTALRDNRPHITEEYLERVIEALDILGDGLTRKP